MPFRPKINETEEDKPPNEQADYESLEYHLVYSELIQAARHQGMTTWQALADLLGLPPKDAHTKQRLGDLLELISWNEVSYKRPMLGALAITQRNFLSDKFFNLARELGELITEGREDAAEFWEEQKQQIYEIWKQKSPK